MQKTLVWIKSAKELPAHLAELAQLDRICLSGEVWEDRLWTGFFQQRKALALKIEGAFILFNLAVDEAEVMKLAVEPQLRRQGVASMLFQEALPILKAEKVQSVFLEVRETNLAARKLYESLGFVLVGERKAYYKKPIENAITYQYKIT